MGRDDRTRQKPAPGFLRASTVRRSQSVMLRGATSSKSVPKAHPDTVDLLRRRAVLCAGGGFKRFYARKRQPNRLTSAD